MKHNAFRWIPAAFAGGAAGRLRGRDRSLCPPGWQPGTEIDPPDSMHATAAITEQYTL